MTQLSYSMNPLFLLGGWTFYQIFERAGLDRILKEVAGNEGRLHFSEGEGEVGGDRSCSFYIKDKLKSEIFKYWMTKKVYKQKCISLS